MTGTGTYSDRCVDAAWMAAALLVATAVAGDAVETGRLAGDMAFVCLLVGVAATVPLWWRRRYPVTVALVVGAFSGLSDSAGGAGLVAVATVATYRSRRAALGMAVLHCVASVPYAILVPDPGMPAQVSLVLGGVLLGLAVLVGRVASHRRELIESLRAQAARAEVEAQVRMEQLRVLERQHIAREMHDTLAHRMSQVSLYAGALVIRDDLGPAEVARAAAAIRDSAHRALEDLRDILGVLRGDTLVSETAELWGGLCPPPGLGQVGELVASARALGTQVECVDRLESALPPGFVSRAAYRVVQEGLTNARKHAPGQPVRVLMERVVGEGLHLLLDNPVPAAALDPRVPGARAGLVGLAERVALAGGRMEAGHRQGPDGVALFGLEAWMPWPT